MGWFSTKKKEKGGDTAKDPEEITRTPQPTYRPYSSTNGYNPNSAGRSRLERTTTASTEHAKDVLFAGRSAQDAALDCPPPRASAAPHQMLVSRTHNPYGQPPQHNRPLNPPVARAHDPYGQPPGSYAAYASYGQRAGDERELTAQEEEDEEGAVLTWRICC